MVIIGEHSNTRKRLAAVLLGTAVDQIALVDIMERHKTMKLITSSSMTELWRHLQPLTAQQCLLKLLSCCRQPLPVAALQRTVSVHSAKIRCYNSGSRCADWHTLNYDKKCATTIYPITWKHNIIRRTIVHNVLHCRQWRTEPWPQLTCTENFMKFGCVTWEQCYVMQKSCPQLFWTNEGLAPTGLLLKVTGIEIRFSLLVQSLAQKFSLILSRWSSGTTTANECAVQYWL